MDVSSSTNVESSSTQTEALKKAIDVQEKVVLQVIESANEESKQINAQKTGLGTLLNISV